MKHRNFMMRIKSCYAFVPALQHEHVTSHSVKEIRQQRQQQQQCHFSLFMKNIGQQLQADAFLY